MTMRSRGLERLKGSGTANDETLSMDLSVGDPRGLLAALDHVADMVLICDAKGRHIFLNPATRALALTEATGAELDSVVWGDWFDRDDQPIDQSEWPLWLALRGAKRVEREMYRRNADGTVFWMLLSAASIRDVNGAIIGAVATAKDITATKQAEAEARAMKEQLAERVGARTTAFETLQRELAQEMRQRLDASELLERSRRMLQAILDRTPAVIYVKDTAFRYLLVNSQYERIFNRTNAEVAGRDDYELFPPDIAAPLRANDERVVKSGERLSIDEVVPQSDGLQHTYVSVKFPLRDDEGVIYAMCGISTDITDRKRVEAELHQAEELARRHQAELAHVLRVHTMGAMAASLAHEINQPLGAIANYAQGSRLRLEQGAMTLDELRVTMAEISREALRAGKITRRVRELIRKDEPSRAPADINDVVRAVLEIVAPGARERGVVVRFYQGSLLPPVEIDRIQIEQVVLNLLLNALDAVVDKGAAAAVEVRTSVVERHIEVVVSDNGCGVDAAGIQQLFEPFFTTKLGGLGMGLAISESIITAHDGDLSAANNSMGGMRFRFTLPFDPEA